jgi:uncharacterized membrane protein
VNRTENLLVRPLHQMLLVFPAGLLISSVLLDLAVVTGTHAFEWAHKLLGMGLLGALAAAPFGWLRWRRIPHGARERWVGPLGAGHGVALVLFAVSWFMRELDQRPPLGALVLSVAGACLLVTTWLGRALVARTQPGVGTPVSSRPDSPGAAPCPNPNALPPSTTNQEAVDLLTSVAGEEDPGAAVDSPAPPCQQADRSGSDQVLNGAGTDRRG